MGTDMIGLGRDRVAVAFDGGRNLATLFEHHAEVGRHRCIPWNVFQRLAEGLLGRAQLTQCLQHAAQISVHFGIARIALDRPAIGRLSLDEFALGGERIALAEQLRGVAAGGAGLLAAFAKLSTTLGAIHKEYRSARPDLPKVRA